MKRLEGKTAIITGASRGQGAEEARLFAEHGATVILTDIAEPAGSALAQELGAVASFVRHDVADPDSWTALMEVVGNEHGRLDVLVNNAGLYRTAPFLDSDVADLDRLYEVNVRGVFLGMQAVAPLMTNSGGGSIVNVASLAAFKAVPNILIYAATKWAARGMTRNAALELAPSGIRVNAIHPGIIDTAMLATNSQEMIDSYAEMTPLGRIGVVADVARTALFLASDESDFVTAGDFPVDGGLAL